MRHLTAPGSLVGLIGPNPRVIADDIWAKLVWAGLNITAGDLPHKGPTRPSGLQHSAYPIEMCRALVVTWLCAGPRNNEIIRLRLGWQREDATVPGAGELLPGDAVCLLDVPVNKTGTAFTKPSTASLVKPSLHGRRCARKATSSRIEDWQGRFLSISDSQHNSWQTLSQPDHNPRAV